MSDEGDQHLDARGLRCPLPVIRMESCLRAMKDGEILVIIADDPIASVDIPYFCHQGGHLCVRLADQEDSCVFRVTACGKTKG